MHVTCGRVAVDVYFFNGNTTLIVFPVLWMTSYFHIMEPESQTTYVIRPFRQVATPGAKTAACFRLS